MFLPQNLIQRKRKRNLILFAHMCVHIHTILVFVKVRGQLARAAPSCSLGSVAPPADPITSYFRLTLRCLINFRINLNFLSSSLNQLTLFLWLGLHSPGICHTSAFWERDLPAGIKGMHTQHHHLRVHCAVGTLKTTSYFSTSLMGSIHPSSSSCTVSVSTLV